ncbi:MAG: 4-hydroxy-tetrahydrodipicolinate reductase [Sphaerochaetaceae bacterium]
MLKIIINGCGGRMGAVLGDLITRSKGAQVVGGIDVVSASRPYPLFSSLKECTVEADVLIDFSSPAGLIAQLETAVERTLPIVAATTGLDDNDLKQLEAASQFIPIFRSANMSVGINLVQQLLHTAAKVLEEGFDVEIIEKHHNQKKDAPSGTALMLADSINVSRSTPLHYTYGREGKEAKRSENELGIHAVRGGTIVGQHEVIFAGDDEIITISHQAFSRQVFAVGALKAAFFIVGKQPGTYAMSDLISS